METRAEIHAVAIAPGFIVVVPQRYSGLIVSFLKLFRCGKKLAVAVATGGVKRKMRYQSWRKQSKLVIFSNDYEEPVQRSLAM